MSTRAKSLHELAEEGVDRLYGDKPREPRIEERPRNSLEVLVAAIDDNLHDPRRVKRSAERAADDKAMFGAQDKLDAQLRRVAQARKRQATTLSLAEPPASPPRPTKDDLRMDIRRKRYRRPSGERREAYLSEGPEGRRLDIFST